MTSFQSYRISLKKPIKKPSSQKFLTFNKHPSANLLGPVTKSNQEVSIHHRNEKQPESDQHHCLFNSCDKHIKAILQKEGWVCSPSIKTRPQLIWVAIPRPQHFSLLAKNSVINHFKDSYILSTKMGLYKLLSCPSSSIVSKSGRNYLSYFPRSYDLQEQFSQFERDFQRTAVMNLLKKLMINFELCLSSHTYSELKTVAQKMQHCPQALFQSIERVLFNPKKLISKRNSPNSNCRQMISIEMVTALLKCLSSFLRNDRTVSQERALEKCCKYSLLSPPFCAFEGETQNSEQKMGILNYETILLLFRVYCYFLKSEPQFLADGIDNVWVVKASESSRGRSVLLMDSLQKIRNYQRGSNRLVQKYIETAWILREQQFPNLRTHYPHLEKAIGRKFDIRLWVLVKSFYPLEAYVYSEGYLRLSSKNYQLDEIEDARTHLTNFSVNHKQKLSKNRKLLRKDWNEEQVIRLDQSSTDSSFVLFSKFLEFIRNEVQGTAGQFDKQQTLQDKIHQVIAMTLTNASVQWKNTESDAQSFELFGFDILLDSSLNPFLLECNMSPSCTQRGDLSRILVEMGQKMLQLVGISQKLSQNPNQGSNFWRRIKVDPQLRQKNVNQNKERVPELEIFGSKMSVKKIASTDHTLSLIAKISFLQRYFKTRYSNIQISSKKVKFSECLRMIELMSKISKRYKRLWIKKIIKRVNKRKSQDTKLSSKFAQCIVQNRQAEKSKF